MSVLDEHLNSYTLEDFEELEERSLCWDCHRPPFCLSRKEIEKLQKGYDVGVIVTKCPIYAREKINYWDEMEL
jgi:hypothetical protein